MYVIVYHGVWVAMLACTLFPLHILEDGVDKYVVPLTSEPTYTQPETTCGNANTYRGPLANKQPY
jgi:hypothetical protein